MSKIAPIICATYGDTDYARSLAENLAARIDARKWDSRGREYMVMLACWDWFSGGTTADNVARRIEAVLDA